MGTPRRSFNNYPPHDPQAGEYPSQSADYSYQQFGGQQAPPHQPIFGFYEDKQRRSQKAQANTPHFYRNAAPQEQQHHQQQRRHQPYGQGRNFGRGGNFNRRGHPNKQDQHQANHQGGNGGAQYFHPSMLEDPWRELMERHEAT
ncbi:hypothetical protein KR009_002642 [Drosophila setifemur]|nr:hypothetical protein KR009_002642 [Drosophila setifemur]